MFECDFLLQGCAVFQRIADVLENIKIIANAINPIYLIKLKKNYILTTIHI